MEEQQKKVTSIILEDLPYDLHFLVLYAFLLFTAPNPYLPALATTWYGCKSLLGIIVLFTSIKTG